MTQDPLQRPKTPFSQGLFLILSGTLLCLILLEIGLRVASCAYTSLNSLPLPDPSAQLRVLCLGESTTLGIGASNPRLFNYPHQLEVMLRERFPSSHVQVLYDGTVGCNTTENLLRLPSYLEKYRPQLVIFMVGVNNWWNLNKSNVLIFNKNKGFSEWVLKTAVFMDQFRVYKLLKSIAYNTGFIKLSTAEPEPIHPGRLFDMKNTGVKDAKEMGKYMERLDDYKKRIASLYAADIFADVAFYDLQEMIGICQKRRIQVIVCNYPRGKNHLCEVQERVASLFHCPFVDNHAFFHQLPDMESYFSGDKSHPNDKGYHFLAQNIFNCILENHMIKPGNSSLKSSGKYA